MDSDTARSYARTRFIEVMQFVFVVVMPRHRCYCVLAYFAFCKFDVERYRRLR